MVHTTALAILLSEKNKVVVSRSACAVCFAWLCPLSPQIQSALFLPLSWPSFLPILLFLKYRASWPHTATVLLILASFLQPLETQPTYLALGTIKGGVLYKSCTPACANCLDFRFPKKRVCLSRGPVCFFKIWHLILRTRLCWGIYLLSWHLESTFSAWGDRVSEVPDISASSFFRTQ